MQLSLLISSSLGGAALGSGPSFQAALAGNEVMKVIIVTREAQSPNRLKCCSPGSFLEEPNRQSLSSAHFHGTSCSSAECVFSYNPCRSLSREL